MHVLSRNSIVKKTLQIGGYTLISRILGLVREILMSHFLGAGSLSDVFVVAFRIPNALRKVFAEGALSYASVPTFVAAEKRGGKPAVSTILTVAFIVFETLLIFCSLLIAWRASWVIALMAPGFSLEQQRRAIGLLRILMPFIFCISSSSLLAGALHTAHHFFVPSVASIILNLFFIGGLLVGVLHGLSLEALCYVIIAGAFAQLFMHVIAYYRCGFTIATRITAQASKEFLHILYKFIPAIVTAGITEINLMIDARFASYLEKGSITLLYYGGRFMGIPLGVFGVAFSTILLPHFARIHTYAPLRMRFYLLESAKLVFWVTLPASILLCFFSETIFYTFFYSSTKFTLAQVQTGAYLLAAYLLGLPFFSLNKILQNVFYAFHNTTIPTLIALVCAGTHIGLNWLLVGKIGALGLALATSSVGFLQAVLSAFLLSYWFGIRLYMGRFMHFIGLYVIQLVLVFTAFYCVYYSIARALAMVPGWWGQFFLYKVGVWLWLAPLCGVFFLALLVTRTLFGIRLYFLDR